MEIGGHRISRIRTATLTLRNGVSEVDAQFAQARGNLPKAAIKDLHRRVKELRQTAESTEDAFRDWTIDLADRPAALVSAVERTEYDTLRATFELEVSAVEKCMARVVEEVKRRKVQKSSKKEAAAEGEAETAEPTEDSAPPSSSACSAFRDADVGEVQVRRTAIVSEEAVLENHFETTMASGEASAIPASPRRSVSPSTRRRDEPTHGSPLASALVAHMDDDASTCTGGSCAAQSWASFDDDDAPAAPVPKYKSWAGAWSQQTAASPPPPHPPAPALSRNAEARASSHVAMSYTLRAMASQDEDVRSNASSCPGTPCGTPRFDAKSSSVSMSNMSPGARVSQSVGLPDKGQRADKKNKTGQQALMKYFIMLALMSLAYVVWSHARFLVEATDEHLHREPVAIRRDQANLRGGSANHPPVTTRPAAVDAPVAHVEAKADHSHEHRSSARAGMKLLQDA
eukprot:gnl/TRDRNA2_/TRDRNA2_184487_c0_seq1.p1 gnl/TRDRNA2_/TRDRNA2_184487_c0~~gnl/TRDRNA2_/TRDRNA2_184487_c0_seq1.p1  ORF type:complete len:458 (+),score=91.72 gnl/TRDRNA2_/TRDRNA2_184487_c0_seq1:87-1460(+)